MHLHILGICGTFMGGLAKIARELGHEVTGCDAQVYPPLSDPLRAIGIHLHEGYDATDRYAAMAFMQAHQARGEVVTGLLYVDPLATDLHTALNTTARPLNTLDATDLCPGAAALAKINHSLR